MPDQGLPGFQMLEVKSTQRIHPPGTTTTSSSDEDDDDVDDDDDDVSPNHPPNFFYQHLYGDHTGLLRDFMFPPDHMLSDTTSVFTKDGKLHLDAYAKYMGRMSYQSDRAFNRIYFCNGISTNAKKQGHEQRSVLLVLLLLYLCSDEGVELEKTMGQSRLSLYVLLLSHMLLMENFLRSFICSCVPSKTVW
jgi:hypothetical protein